MGVLEDEWRAGAAARADAPETLAGAEVR
jgi:hypothetical protein